MTCCILGIFCLRCGFLSWLIFHRFHRLFLDFKLNLECCLFFLVIELVILNILRCILNLVICFKELFQILWYFLLGKIILFQILDFLNVLTFFSVYFQSIFNTIIKNKGGGRGYLYLFIVIHVSPFSLFRFRGCFLLFEPIKKELILNFILGWNNVFLVLFFIMSKKTI